MAACQSCGQKIKWYLFRREICQNCSSDWDGLLAKVNVTVEDPGSGAAVAEGKKFYDLDNLLSSIQVREVDLKEEEIFSDVWVTRPYPAKSFATSVMLHVGMISFLFGLSGMKFSQTLPLTREALERDYEITYYKPADLLPKITSASDGPKDRRREAPRFIPLKQFNRHRQSQTTPPRRSFSQALPTCRSNRRSKFRTLWSGTSRKQKLSRYRFPASRCLRLSAESLTHLNSNRLIRRMFRSLCRS